MDVGNPSNFIRILEIFHHQFPELKKHLSSFSITDEETMATIKEVDEKFNYLLDPHGAVGYLSLQRYLQDHADKKARLSDGQGIFLETAHPVKFPESVEKSFLSYIYPAFNHFDSTFLLIGIFSINQS